MKRQLNYDLLLFHVREACQELAALLLRIKKMLGELEAPLSEEEKAILDLYDRPLEVAGLGVSFEHAYHHLNFAWNVRYKETVNFKCYPWSVDFRTKVLNSYMINAIIIAVNKRMM